jgi:hypothetical protein
MQQKMYRGLTAATLVLLALVVLAIASPAVRAAEDIVYTVVVDLNSTPPRALNAATGQPLSQSDVQVVNPEDQHTYELQAKDITGNAVDLWVVEQHIDGSNVVHWAATNITSTKTYHTWAQAKLRAWVQKNRDEACANAERLDQSFSCTAVEPPWVIFLPIVQR